MYTIITTPNKTLLGTAKSVTSFDKKLKTILSGMAETLIATSDPIGVGLAAPQVGISLRVFQMKPTEKSKVTSFINPVIESISKEDSKEVRHAGKISQEKSSNKLLEGCLSLPNIWGNVQRRKELALSWQDEAGNKFKQTFTGFPAIIIQHEVDHLNGILFTKHVISQKEKLFKSHKDEKDEDVFEEIKI